MAKGRSIPEWVRCALWGKAAGRCQMCNKPLSYHPKTREAVNLGQAAHIIGFSPDGPRGERELSAELAQDVTNLMLLDGDCHKTIDFRKPSYPVERLRKLKERHERRIAIASAIDEDRASHVLLYGANVGEHGVPLSWKTASAAMIPEEWYPAEDVAISLGMINSSLRDTSRSFWKLEAGHLRRTVESRLRPRLASGEIRHLSIFGLAPQPLLVLLGSLLSDIGPAETYQLHREPTGWRWKDHPQGFSYSTREPERVTGDPALVISLSATVTDDRIRAALPRASIWRLGIPKPRIDFLRSRRQLEMFREEARTLLDRIKARHGTRAVLHVFPAAPPAVAVELGRVLMPKADLSLRVYDENRSLGGFVHALDINEASGRKGAK